MSTLTTAQLKRIFPLASASSLASFAGPLNDAMAEFGITTPARMAAFLAQVGHESGQLRYVRELASGTAYEGRADLGNTQPGDGARYRGRGLIQITGRANYQAASIALLGDAQRLLDNPALLEGAALAARSAAWFWRTKQLSALADAGRFDDITQRINGGQNGRADRRKLWASARQVLQC
jgi:putative chitinase